ncbi:hypothetical protein BKFM_00366 [Borrelia sp. HM]|nr:hypothetical protein BKFM_00366 [Borrelia sp. HM]
MSLSDSIIIIDINIEHKELSSIGFKNDVVSSRNLLEKRFSSRFLDLVDHIFFFRPVDESDFEKAIIEEMNNFVKILKAENIFVCFEECVIHYLRDKTYKSGLGIKSVHKVVVKEIGSLLINDLILKRFKDNDKVRVYLLDKTIKYELL